MMGRLPGRREEEENNNSGVKKGPWTPEEDRLLVDYIKKHGHGSWRALPKLAGLNRCGKSCRLRWTNYLRPDIKRGKFTDEEEKLIISMHAVLGNKWSAIAGKLPGRTDNEIKNFWNTHLRKKLLQMGLDPVTHRPKTEHLDLISYLNQLLTAANIITGLTTNAPFWLNTSQQQSPKLQMLHTMLLQILASNNNNNHPVLPNVESLLLNNNNTTNNNLLPLEPIVPPLPNDLYEAALGLNNNTNNNFQNLIDSPNSTSCIMYEKLIDDNEEQVFDATTNSVPTTPPSFTNSLPNLVSASSPPECSTNNNNNNIKQSNDDVMIDPNEFSNPSSSATFGIWPSDFIYEEATDVYWNGLIGGRESNHGQP